MTQDFRTRTIYFVVTDRFFNSDPQNDGGRDPDSYDGTRTDWRKYWGGDLGGILAKLGYIQELGATALWITPVFEQAKGLVGEGGHAMSAYHGYWARDFRRLDPHLAANPEDVRVFSRNETVFDKLVVELAQRGMSLVLDVVCNHSSPGIRNHKGELYDDGEFLTSYENDILGWYHRKGVIGDWRDAQLVQDGELCGLSDFDEHAYRYREYIKQVMKDWIDKGLDALRVDTVKHMPLWFWQEWMSDLLSHRPSLFLVGEWFQGGCYDAASVEFANRSGMTIFDFSLQRALEDCLARNAQEGFHLVQNVIDRDMVFNRATHLVTFVDNHDMPRFLSVGGTTSRLELATHLILVGRGIPCLYYGDEQYLHDDREGGKDPYNRPMMTRFEPTRLTQTTAILARLRRENPAVQRGYHQQRFLTSDTYVFERAYGGSVCVAAFNRGAARSIGPIQTALPDGDYECLLTGRLVQVRGGCIEQLDLAADDSLVLSHVAAAKPQQGTRISFQLCGYATRFGERIAVVGSAPELGSWDVNLAPVLNYVNANLWEGDVDFTASSSGLVRYKYAVLRDGRDAEYEPSFPRRGWIPMTSAELRTDHWGK